MCFTRSNHDIKFVPSGKDGKSIAWYETNDTTKADLSFNNTVAMSYIQIP